MYPASLFRLSSSPASSGPSDADYVNYCGQFELCSWPLHWQMGGILFVVHPIGKPTLGDAGIAGTTCLHDNY